MFYGWSLVIFTYKLPGWLYYLTLTEIGGILAHQLMVNLLESAVALVLLLLVCAILPARFLKDEFPVRGTAVSIIMIGAMMVFLVRAAAAPGIGGSMALVMLVALAAAVLAAVFSTRFRPVRAALLWLSDRLIVFLFILLPLSAVSMIYLLVRSLL